MDTNFPTAPVLEKPIMEPTNTVGKNRKNDIPKRGIEHVNPPVIVSEETLAKTDQRVTRSGNVYRNVNNDNSKSKRQFIKQ